MRRRKNNPLYVGDPGVGKTTIVEGLVLKIIEGSVPSALRSSIIYALDLGSLLAGTPATEVILKREKIYNKSN
nr:hypothetical protein [Wolbachia endosymbiont of Kradibia gibbosae]